MISKCVKHFKFEILCKLTRFKHFKHTRSMDSGNCKSCIDVICGVFNFKFPYSLAVLKTITIVNLSDLDCVVLLLLLNVLN